MTTPKAVPSPCDNCGSTRGYEDYDGARRCVVCRDIAPVPEEVEKQIEAIIRKPSRSPISTADIAVGFWSSTVLAEKVHELTQLLESYRQATIKEVVERVQADVIGDDEQLAQKLADVRRLGFNTSSEIVANNRVRNKLRAKQRAALKKIEEEMV